MNKEIVNRLYGEAVDWCSSEKGAWAWEEKFSELVALEATKVCEQVYPEGSPYILFLLASAKQSKHISESRLR